MSPARRRTLRPRQAISVDDYTAIYSQPIPTTRQLSPATLTQAKQIWKRFECFCADFSFVPLQLITTLQREQLGMFMHWFVNNSKITKRSSLWALFRRFREAYAIKAKKVMPQDLVAYMQNLIPTLQLNFELSGVPKVKPTLSANDLVALLEHHWARCTEFFATERQRLQIALLLLLVVYTSARPSAIVESHRDKTKEDAGPDDDPDFLVSRKHVDALPDCLKYKDVRIHKIRDPHGTGEHLFIMVIELRLMKGFRNAGSFPKYVLYERDDNLAFCPLLHVFALAFADQAFLSDFIRVPEDLYAFEVPDHLQSVPVEWKPEFLEKPLLRRSIESVTGKTTCPTRGVTYNDACMAVGRLGKSAGYGDPFTLYAARRGAGEGIDRVATDAVRNRAMGHSRSEIFSRFYTNSTVNVDTMACFLGTPSENWRVEAASHMTLKRDPSASSVIPVPTPEEITSYPEVAESIARKNTCRAEILRNYRSITAARGSKLYSEYQEAQSQYKFVRSRAKREISQHRWHEHFGTLGTKEIQRQAQGSKVFSAETPYFDLEERAELAETLCNIQNVSTMSSSEVRTRRLRSLHTMIRLCGRRAAPFRPPTSLQTNDGSAPFQPDVSQEEMYKNHQCPWCYYDDSLSMAQRAFGYKQLKDLRMHIEKKHIALMPTTTSFDGELLGFSLYDCPFTLCGRSFATEHVFKNHMAADHLFTLTAPLYGDEIGCKMDDLIQYTTS